MDALPKASPPTAPAKPTLREFLELVREDFDVHQCDWRMPGFQAILGYRLGRLRRALYPRWSSKPVTLLHLFLQRRARDRFGIELYDTATIGRGVRIIHQNGIVIHRYATIGDRCWIRQNVTIGSRNEWSREDVATIGCEVRIGVGAVIAGALTIGDCALIGPNTVVLGDVPAGATVKAPDPEIRVRKSSANVQPR